MINLAIIKTIGTMKKQVQKMQKVLRKTNGFDNPVMKDEFKHDVHFFMSEINKVEKHLKRKSHLPSSN
ncbi:MAG: hypothetical protein Q7R95_08740 [bacterium]|nr:hypothetical protein [bacterium]